jgi:hypothetical protein
LIVHQIMDGHEFYTLNQYADFNNRLVARIEHPVVLGAVSLERAARRLRCSVLDGKQLKIAQMVHGFSPGEPLARGGGRTS